MTAFANAETLALHAGPRMDPTTGAVAVPIYQTTAFQFRDTEHAASLFALKEIGHIYSRITNPTCDALEQKMAAMEGGVMAMGVSSGQAATALAVQNICHAGDNIVVSTDIYGGTWNLFAHTFKTMGIEARFVDPANPEAFRKATDAAHPRLLRGIPAQPEADDVPHRRSGAHRPRTRRAADHGQHRVPGHLPALRPWRGHHRLFHDEIHRRPWHRHRRHDHRRRKFRLGKACRALPHAQPA